MLTLQAPFILGIVIQISAMMSAVLAAPLDDHTVATRIKRDDFAYRLDIAVFAPAMLTLLGSSLLNRGHIPDTVVTFLIAGTVLLFLIGLLILRQASATNYMLMSNRLFGVTPLNVGIIAANLALAGFTYFTASPNATS